MTRVNRANFTGRQNPFEQFHRSNPFEQFHRNENSLESMSSEDLLMPGIPGEPEYEARQAEIRRRKQVADAERKGWLDSRGPVERLKDTASFVGSVPVRMFTQGQHGLGDVLSAVGAESAASSVNEAESDFVKANPDLIWTLGAAGEVSAGIPALNTMAPGIRGASRVRTPRDALKEMRARQVLDDVASFDRAGVEKFSPAFMEGPMRNLAKGVADTAVVGNPVRNALDNSLLSTAQAARRTSERFGTSPTPDQAARTMAAGLERYKNQRTPAPSGQTPAQRRSATLTQPARETSIKTKQDAIYEKAWSFLPASMRQGRSVEGVPRLMIPFQNTRQLLQDIRDRNTRMTVQSGNNSSGRAPVIETSGFTRNVVDALLNAKYQASLQTAREIRSRFRRIVSALPENERNILNRSDIRRVESAITQDIISGLERFKNDFADAGRNTVANNIQRSIRTFRRADQFTRASMERIETAKRLFNATDDLQLYRSIEKAGVQGDIPKLKTLRRVLRADEMDELSSSLVREMGRPIASARDVAQDIGFSVSSFTSRWNKMVESNPQTVNLLFPNRAHRQALTDLVAVANRLANVESMKNFSGTYTTGGNVGMIGAAGAAYAANSIEIVLASLAATGAVSVLLSRPELTRWLATYMRLREAAMRSPAANPRLQEHVNRLSALTGREAALQQIQQQVESDNQ